MADPEGEILTLEEVAAYLKAGKRTVYRLAQEGKIPAFKLGGSWRFRRAELDRADAAIVPIVAMTANAFTEDIAMAKDAGMNGYVTKPIAPQHLYQTLYKVLTQA